MHPLLLLAPEAPGLLAFEYLDRPRQVVGRISMVEFIAQRFGNDSANDQKRFWHESTRLFRSDA
jgi:hypothetical protein